MGEQIVAVLSKKDHPIVEHPVGEVLRYMFLGGTKRHKGNPSSPNEPLLEILNSTDINRYLRAYMQSRIEKVCRASWSKLRRPDRWHIGRVPGDQQAKRADAPSLE